MLAAKITTTIPFNLKSRLVSFKEDIGVSMSAIFKEALERYLDEEEAKKWEKGANLAAKNKEYMQLCNTLGHENGEIHEY